MGGSADHREASFLPLPSEEASTGAVLTVVVGCLTGAVPPGQDLGVAIWLTWATGAEPCIEATWGEGEGPTGETSTR